MNHPNRNPNRNKKERAVLVTTEHRGDCTSLERVAFVAPVIGQPSPNTGAELSLPESKAPEAKQTDLIADLTECARMLESVLLYEMKRDAKAGDDEGVRLKQFTLARVRTAIAKAEQL